MFGATPNFYRNETCLVNRSHNASTETPEYIENREAPREAKLGYVSLSISPKLPSAAAAAAASPPPRKAVHASREASEHNLYRHRLQLWIANSVSKVTLGSPTSSPILALDFLRRKTPKKSLIPALRD
jgi:hypothetical protein